MKKQIIISLMILLIMFSIYLASAEFWACFNKGERIDFCNPKTPDRTCSSSVGCEYCMSSYNETRNCYNQGNWMVCMGIERICSGIGGGGEIDGEPPVLTINNPEQDGLYTSKSILLDFILDEKASVYYYDNINGRGRWTRICSGCYSHSRNRRFKEGFNDLTFRAVDVIGNEMLLDMSFFVDTKKPRIHKVEPRKGYASGLFEIQYTEENLDKIEIIYGNSINGFDTKIADGSSTEAPDCVSGTRQWCSVEIDLNEYDGQEIEYYFTIKDIVGNVKESRHIKVNVDITPPILNNPDSFWERGTGRNNKYIYFNLSIDEENFDSVEYYDNEESRPRWRKLCTRLKDGKCEKRKSFRRGEHVLDVQITDEAGNSIAERIEFEVV